MRWPFWRTADSDSDTLDPELLSLLAKSTRLPEVGVSDLARGRARVAAHLAPQTAPPVAGGWLRRRFAWSVAGGGSMWAAVLGTAFASKASTAAVGLTVLLAGAGTAEVTGIGPAVRESLGISEPSASSNAADQGAEAQNNAVGSENAAEQAANVSSDDEATGNLVTNIRPDGSFTVRGILSAAGVETSGELLLLGEVEITVPGQRNPNADAPELSDYYDYLVLATGTCSNLDHAEFNMTDDCTVESVSILGQAAQGQPTDAGQPGVLPGSAPDDAGQPDEPGKPDDAGQPGLQSNSGQKPEDAPPANAQGGNPNSD